MFGYISTSDNSYAKLSFEQTIWPPSSNPDASSPSYLLFVRSINLFVLDFAFTSNLFPVFSGLKIKTNEECIKAVSYSCLVAGSIFIFTGYTTLFLFGNPMASHQNFMNSVNNEYIRDPSHWETYIIRITFITLIVCHIPFVFFNGKEALLIIIDEIDRKSVSDTLEKRIKLLEQFEKAIDETPEFEGAKNEEETQMLDVASMEGATPVHGAPGGAVRATNERFTGIGNMRG